jgi:hypothetical protein
MREDKISRGLAETILTGGRQALDAGVFSLRRLEDRITPAHLVEGLSGLIALRRFARDAACAVVAALRLAKLPILLRRLC